MTHKSIQIETDGYKFWSYLHIQTQSPVTNNKLPLTNYISHVFRLFRGSNHDFKLPDELRISHKTK